MSDALDDAAKKMKNAEQDSRGKAETQKTMQRESPVQKP